MNPIFAVVQSGARPSEQEVSVDAFTQLVALSGSSNQNVAVGAARLLPIFCATQEQVCSNSAFSAAVLRQASSLMLDSRKMHDW